MSEQKFQCTECEKKFTSQQALAGHSGVHKNRAPWSTHSDFEPGQFRGQWLAQPWSPELLAIPKKRRTVHLQ